MTIVCPYCRGVIEQAHMKPLFSKAHQHILDLRIEGISRRDIATRLGISENTIRGQFDLMAKRTGIHEEPALVAYYIKHYRQDILPPEEARRLMEQRNYP